MIELYYDAYLIAYYILSRDMGSKKMLDFLNRIYVEENEFLHPDYKSNKKAFISDVMYCMDYLVDKEELDKEFPVIEKDFKVTGRSFDRERYTSEFSGMDMYFAWMRLEILYTLDKDYVKIKLKTLLARYGYKRRSPIINEQLRDCVMFYHLQPYLRGGEECDLRDISIDDMVTFRIPGKKGDHSTEKDVAKEASGKGGKKSKGDIIPDGMFYLSRYNTELDRDIKATMKLDRGKYIVLAGSDYCEENSDSLSLSLLQRRKKALVQNGVLIKDEIFTSASAAAMFVLGNSESGLRRWKDKNGFSLREYMIINGDIVEKKKARAKTPLEIAFKKMTSDQQVLILETINEMLGKTPKK